MPFTNSKNWVACKMVNGIPEDFIRFSWIYALRTNKRIIEKVTAPTNAEAGIVSIHAHTIRRATPQRTADKRVVEPTPTIAPVMV